MQFTKASPTIYQLEEVCFIEWSGEYQYNFWWIILVVVRLNRRLDLQNLMFLSCTFTLQSFFFNKQVTKLNCVVIFRQSVMVQMSIVIISRAH